MLRKIINIEEELCDGCGNCVPECHEGALQIIDGKARLISDLFCDGLGACLGHCPTGALTIEEREAEAYDERKVMDMIVKGGENVIVAHINHLMDHKEYDFATQAIDYLNDHGIPIPERLTERNASKSENSSCSTGGCPGSAELSFTSESNEPVNIGRHFTALGQWPIQLHLLSPNAQFLRDSHLLLAADCCGFTAPNFHPDFLSGKSLAIACPKLDSNQQNYLDKLTIMVKENELKEITVMIMQVPCCRGLVQLAQKAIENSGRTIPLNAIVLDIHGEILQEVTI